MSAELEDGEDPIKAAEKLKETVLISLGLIKPTTEKQPSNTDDDEQTIDQLPF